MLCSDVRANRCLVLQATRGTDTYKGKLTEVLLLLAGLEVDICQRI